MKTKSKIENFKTKLTFKKIILTELNDNMIYLKGGEDSSTFVGGNTSISAKPVTD